MARRDLSGDLEVFSDADSIRADDSGSALWHRINDTADPEIHDPELVAANLEIDTGADESDPDEEFGADGRAPDPGIHIQDIQASPPLGRP